jgi:hypothetical protein
VLCINKNFLLLKREVKQDALPQDNLVDGAEMDVAGAHHSCDPLLYPIDVSIQSKDAHHLRLVHSDSGHQRRS